ncbi:MAG TPA: bifunctional demethylmenaquinone methyltransferase/2-methoxy-6-polyprenyl-1,4-benzoquinol methylase UbiE [Candidatus Polarisedimenticolia bacterium]|nr:bifunctional demethylmenaquinone methyltransferase/2-methoxy-6-polyprenyl-1,4-benzoquinol methylase UbiE [Candidatus Polarisedimenticolia bacterium]
MPVAADVRRMFGSIAVRYDLLNRILSLGTDRAWRRRACDLLRPLSGEAAADLCCGTGDLTLELESRGASAVGVDFSREMLGLAAAKGAARLAEADCLRLPFPDRTFDLVTVAFGVRNLADLETGLREILRVLKPGGRAGILEFASPRGAVFRTAYGVYLRWVVPAVGAAVSGRRSAYDYLGSSIQAFPDQARMAALLAEAGFRPVRHHDFARGIAALYVAHRP